jgi:transaldolase
VTATNPLRRLAELGQQVWLDDIRRSLVTSGQLARLIADDGLAGLTSNPAIFAKAIADSTDYDSTLTELAPSKPSAESAYEHLAIADVRSVADAFIATYHASAGLAGYVSLEVSPHLAHDTPGTIAAAERLWAAVARPNLMVKVPATRAGIPAIRHLIAAGINLNVTLIFSLTRYREVFEAFTLGIEDRVSKRASVASIASVASFFISRIDSAVDPRLEKLIAGGDAAARELLGKAAVASAGGAMAAFFKDTSGTRWRDLAAAGAKPQKLLWASTSTKNKAYSDVKYVEELVAAGTVNTMPPETLAAYRDHGQPELRIDHAIRTSEATVRALAERGIDLELVADELEREGVKKFAEPYDHLLRVMAERLKR